MAAALYDETVELAPDGVKRIAVINPGFVSDCLETLEEIAVQGCESFLHHGGERFSYIPALDDFEAHVDLIEQMTMRELGGWIDA